MAAPDPELINAQRNGEDIFPAGVFHVGDRVRKKSGSNWTGIVVGRYATKLTPEGYAVESDTEKGSVQIYPGKALERAASQSEEAEGDFGFYVDGYTLASTDVVGEVKLVGPDGRTAIVKSAALVAWIERRLEGAETT